MTEEFIMTSPAFSISSSTPSLIELADPASPSIATIKPRHPHPAPTISVPPHPSPAITHVTTPGRDIFPHLWEEPSGWARVEKRFECLVPACNHATFKWKFGLQRHWVQVHQTQAKQFNCNKPRCRVSTTNVDDMRCHVRMLHGVKDPKGEVFPTEMVKNGGYVSPGGMAGPTADTKTAKKKQKPSRSTSTSTCNKRKSEGYITMFGTDEEVQPTKERKTEEKKKPMEKKKGTGEKKPTEEKEEGVIKKIRHDKLLVTVDINVNEEKESLINRLNEISREKERLNAEETRVKGELQLLEVQKWRERFYELLDENKKVKEEMKGLKERVRELECKCENEEESEFRRMYEGWKMLQKMNEK